jgi:hypothetical protein
MAEAWVKYLTTTDDVAKRRGPEWVRQLAEWLVTNDCQQPEDLGGLSIDDLAGVKEIPEVKLALMRRITKKVTREMDAADNTCAGGSAAVDTALAKIAELVPKPEEKLTVDIGATLEQVNMKGLNPDVWPRPAAVNALATDGAKQKKTGIAHPYVLADLRKFVPLWMATDKELEDQGDEESAKEQGSTAVAELTKAFGLPVSKKKNHAMSISHWSAAFDAYALAAASVKQWSFTAAYAHKCVVLKLAGDSYAEGRSVAVAVLYERQQF